MHDESLFGQPPPQGYDEVHDAHGRLRAHWQPLVERLQRAGPARIEQEWRNTLRLVRENGVSYNVTAQSQHSARPWDLDLLPMIVPAHEWAGIESAVRQRAGLFDRILGDLYGPQQLLHEGLLPTPLVCGHAGYLRPCHGLLRPGQRALHVYAADLARSPDGRWWVLADRTQAPSGIGYALENRLAIERAFPESFAELRVRGLSPFLLALRDGLVDASPRTDSRAVARALGAPDAGADAAPLIVLLTAGPYNETFSEQAFLARLLGFALVQGSDLTVRRGFVWLKTLAGLQRVHTIVRRLDDDYCDPLFLRGDSLLGIAGLVDAARRGNVVIANPLGSSLVESGAMLGFLPSLCERLDGAPLQMPSVATWWCGEPAALAGALARLDRLVFKPAWPQLRQMPVFGADLSGDARAQFVRTLRASPAQWVAQESVRLSQPPVWRGGESHPAGIGHAAASLRVFACATAHGWVVMPGGLTRIATGPDERVVSMQSGGASKDTWVVAAAASPARPSDDARLLAGAGAWLLARNDAVTPAAGDGTRRPAGRGPDRVTSRTVENLYWFGRYSERCEAVARLLRRCVFLGIEGGQVDGDPEWALLVSLARWHGLLDADTPVQHAPQVLLDAITSADGPGVSSGLKRLHEVASRLHERLSMDHWRMLNRMALRVAARRGALNVQDALRLLDETVVSMKTLTGFALDGMARDAGWRFMSIGRRLERAQGIALLLRSALQAPRRTPLEGVLEIADSMAAYRAHYLSRPDWAAVLELLVVDESSPHSVRFQLEAMLKHLQAYAKGDAQHGSALLLPVLSAVRALDAADLHHGSSRLPAVLDHCADATSALSDYFARRFFSLSVAVPS